MSTPEDRTSAAKDSPSVLEVVEEHLVVGKRVADTGGVRITKTVRERQEVVDLPLLHEEISIERRPVGRMLDGPVVTREEDGVTIVPVIEEVLVVKKRLFLKEELHIRKVVREEHRPQQHVLRSEEVVIEALEPVVTERGAAPKGEQR